MRLGRCGSELLLAAGYVPEFIPEDWEDVGGPESGPKLVGHAAAVGYTTELSPDVGHEIIVQDDEVVYSGSFPIMLEMF